MMSSRVRDDGSTARRAVERALRANDAPEDEMDEPRLIALLPRGDRARAALARTRNPEERRVIMRPSELASAADHLARTYAEESARGGRLARALARCERASKSRPDLRVMCALLSQAMELCDRRRRGTLAALMECAVGGEGSARRLRAFARANEWTAVELECAGGEAVAIGSMKRALAKCEREMAEAVESVLGSGKRKRDETSPPPPPPREGGRSPRISAPSPVFAGEPEDDARENANDASEEQIMLTAQEPREDSGSETMPSPTPSEETVMTQPIEDEASDREMDTLTSPTTKNVVQILMEMDLPNHACSIEADSDG